VLDGKGFINHYPRSRTSKDFKLNGKSAPLLAPPVPFSPGNSGFNLAHIIYAPRGLMVIAEEARIWALEVGVGCWLLVSIWERASCTTLGVRARVTQGEWVW
jgi:hypothetical protein